MRRPTPALATTLVLLAGCVATIDPPVVADVRATRPLREVHQCVTEQLVDRGYAITETRRDDGVVHAEMIRAATRQTTTSVVSDRIEVLIFERSGGDTSIQYVADTFLVDGGHRVGPTPEVAALPEALSRACGR